MAERQMADVSVGPEPRSVVIIGAGPAGLTAAYELMKVGRAAEVTILESTTSSAGSAAPSSATAGASTSAATASSPRCKPVDDLWFEILGPDDFLQPPAP